MVSHLREPYRIVIGTIADAKSRSHLGGTPPSSFLFLSGRMMRALQGMLYSGL